MRSITGWTVFLCIMPLTISCSSNETAKPTAPNPPTDEPTPPDTPPEPPPVPVVPDPPIPPPPPADPDTIVILADVDRDGHITEADITDHGIWSKARGAIIIPNVDDDDRDGERDSHDLVLNGEADRDDLTVVEITLGKAATPDQTITFDLESTVNQGAIRLYTQTSQDIAPILAVPDNQGRVALKGPFAQGTQRFWIEATEGRSAHWDGSVHIKVGLYDHGTRLGSDVLALRVAPVIFQDNTANPETLTIMRIRDTRNAPNTAFWKTVHDHLPATVSLIGADEERYYGDRWMQDNMQIGYVEQPSVAGPRRTDIVLQAQRPTGEYGLEYYVAKEMLAPGTGYFSPGGHDTSHNYGGNLEVIPPYGMYPYGRLIIGGGDQGTLSGIQSSDHMAPEQLAWLNAQEIQGPALEYSSEWLAVGHLDEIFLFVPDFRPDQARPWKIVIASPAMAYNKLVEIANTDRDNDHVIFKNRSTETSVWALLDDPNVRSINSQAQQRINSIRVKLKEDLGITDADFVDVPVLYETAWYDGVDLAVSQNPGIQNLVVVGNTFFVPAPEGPTINHEDVWQKATTSALTTLGTTVHFVDVFESYHLLMGEAHCGSNIVYTPNVTPWWSL